MTRPAQATVNMAADFGTNAAGSHAPPSAEQWREAYEASLPYTEYLERHATPEQRTRWNASLAGISLSESYKRLLATFVRRMPVLVLSGTWCGDCVNQCPIFARFAEASPVVMPRFLDRDALPSIAAHLRVCGGQRVPVALFLSEDFHPVVAYGDRTLSAYRAAIAAETGSSCASGVVGPPADQRAAVVDDWLREFERTQLVLRLSGRLRQLHGD
ncbi:MAG: thioredoxin family protein [Planctomycetaceae bacterium]